MDQRLQDASWSVLPLSPRVSDAMLQAFQPPGEGGWIGYWSPRIGDPTIGGWLTVLLYVAAAVVCFRVGRNRSWSLSRSETLLFRLLALVLVALAVNKQLDLQTAFTEIGRMVAAEGGWYAERRAVQRAFMVAVALAAMATSAASILLLRRTPAPTRLAVVGALGLLTFVVIRASSFHHVDVFIHASVFGVKANWVIEMGSILVVIAGAAWRERLVRSDA